MVQVIDQNIPMGYKQTEIGVIPEDWDVKKIIDFTDCTAGGTPSTLINEYWGGNIKWMSSGELNYKKIFDVEGRITEQGLKNSSTKIVPKYCVLIGLAGQGKTRGTTAINYVDLCTNQSIAAIYPSKNHDSEYLYFNLDRRYLELRSLSTGGEGRGGLNLSIIRKILVAFPKKHEQAAIASVLSDTDVLIEKLEKLIAKKKAIKQGVMQQLLTGKKRLPGFSGEWARKRLGEIGEITGSGVDKKTSPEETPVRLINFLNVYHQNFIYSKDLNHLVTAKPDQIARCSVKRGDVFFTPSSEMPFDIGLSAVAMEDMSDVVYSYHVDRLRLFEDWDLLFRAYIFQTKDFSDQTATQCEGSGKRYVLNLTTFRERLMVYYPKDKKEQSAIASALSDMDAEIETHEKLLTKYRQIKTGMMQQLLTGKIRLIEKTL